MGEENELKLQNPENIKETNRDDGKERDIDLEARLLERPPRPNANNGSSVKSNNNNNNNNKSTDTKPIKLEKSSKPSKPSKPTKPSKEKSENDKAITEDINKFLREMPLTDETTCGFWIFKGRFLQKFANQTAYVLLYGLVGCIFSMTYAYFNGTITTIEKRFKIPSKNTGIISVGNDISQMFVSAVLSYYAGKGHRPRWIGFGLLTIVIFCLLTAAPHFLYGPGADALSLTAEFGALPDENATMEAMEIQRSKLMCRTNDSGTECVAGEGNLAPQLVLFVAQLISGIGGSLYYTLGVSYMDDNTKKSKTPALLSLSYFLRMLGPAMGYALASFCLRVYIAPQLRPVINNKDPRWLGAWWLGWLVIGGMLFASGIFLTMFPKDLPRAVARKMVEEERRRQKAGIKEKESQPNQTETEDASLKDMFATFKRLTTNKTLMCNNLSSIFYLFGYMPYWIFTPKYIEIQYRQSASTSSLVTGTVALAFSAIGVLLSGFVISKYKPRARYMAAWNVLVGFLTVGGMLSYAFIGCPGNEKSVIVNIHDGSVNSPATCNSNCHCDYVRYSPVCGENNMTYISPCHAGCKQEYMASHGKKIYYDCACIPNNRNRTLNSSPVFERLTAANQTTETAEATTEWSITTTTAATTTTFYNISQIPLNFDSFTGGQATPGACTVNCYAQFVLFLGVMCFLKFVGATGRASNFLVSVRCVPEKDKTAAMGFGLMLMSVFAFIPSPIFFGWVLDKLCLVWGKTCTNKGNCWLYDPLSLRFTLNIIASAFVTVGSIFDVGVWYYVKDLKIFDEEVKELELEIVQHEEDATAEKKTEI